MLKRYASARDLLPIVNDVLSNRAKSNCSHMPVRTMKIKDIRNDNVCSPISRSINDDNQMVTEELHQHKFIGDKREKENDDDEGGEEEIHQLLDRDRHKHDLSLSSFSRKRNHLTSKMTRCTDIDAAALTLKQQHEIHFDELLLKEAQLNHALADLISISNDVDKPTSIDSPPTTCGTNQRVLNGKNNTNLSASIELLNNLLDTFDIHDEDLKNKKETKNKSKVDIRPINMFW